MIKVPKAILCLQYVTKYTSKYQTSSLVDYLENFIILYNCIITIQIFISYKLSYAFLHYFIYFLFSNLFSICIILLISKTSYISILYEEMINISYIHSIIIGRTVLYLTHQINSLIIYCAFKIII